MEKSNLINKKIVKWFNKNQRLLPWRENYDPYEIWISEIMLQQTKVETVLPYFKRWIEKYPSIPKLAEANIEDLLKSWEGLGYYTRVRNIFRTARIIQNDFGGQLPKNREAILKLPGIGAYTAGAILSIAFKQKEYIVDGNVKRLLSRLFAWTSEISSRKSELFFKESASNLVQQGSPRELNQGLMELGALICTPKNPKCFDCCIEKFCEAHKKGIETTLPVKSKRSARKVAEIFFLFRNKNKYFLQKWENTGIWESMWSFPIISILPKETIKIVLPKVISNFLEKNQIHAKISSPFKTLSYGITKFRVKAYFVEFEVEQVNSSFFNTGKWLTREDLEKITLNKPSRSRFKTPE